MHDHSEIRIPLDPAIFETLIPFRDLQRTIVAIDFDGIRAGRQAAAALTSVDLPGLVELQQRIQAQIARSVDFSALADLRRTWAKSVPQLLDQAKWAQGLAQSINLPALLRANELLADVEFPAIAEAQRAVAAALASHSEGWLKSIQSLDMARLLVELDRWLPANLRDVTDLEAVARLALDEGLPLSWVPRSSIVQALLDAGSPEERLDLLDTHREDVLADCDVAVASLPHQWAHECSDAIRALQAGLGGPAQSHAAGIIDSIVLCALGPRNGRQLARERAVEDWEDLALRVAGESLALRPLCRALVTWWPGSGNPPPDHFARHPTAHAVGQPGLFHRRHALIAVMLAVSLTVQFWDDPAAADGLLPVPPSRVADGGGDDSDMSTPG